MRKSTRLSSIGLTQVTEPVRSFRTRFSLTSFTKRVQSLTAEQRSAISKTGFGSLLAIPNHSLNKVFLAELMEAWDCECRAFTVAEKRVQMTLLDVVLILGLPVVGKRVAFTEEEPFSELEELYGAARGKRKVAMGSLEARLDSLGDVVDDDFVRTFLLYTIGTFLSSNDGKVDSRYLSFLVDLDEVSRFAWGAAVVEDLCLWLDKRKQNNVQYVGGCLIFLQTWSYEHFDIARPHLQDHDLTFPRVCRWDHSKSHQRQRGTSRFKDLQDDQVIWKLQPTSEELQIEIIKEAPELLDDNKEVRMAENCSASTSSNVQVPGVESDSQLSISSKVHREDEVNFENEVVEDTPTRISICDGEKEINLENLIVEETPPNSSICDKVEQEMNREDDEFHAEKLIVEEDNPTSLSVQELNAESERHTVEDTPPKLSFYDDDLRMKNAMLEEENTELKMKFGQIMEENGLLRKQIMSSTQLEEQNNELKRELDLLREQNRILNLSISSFVAQMDKHILDFETNTTE